MDECYIEGVRALARAQIVYRVLSIYRVLPGFREFAVFEKSKRFFYIFFGWVLHRGGQGPGKGPNIYRYISQQSILKQGFQKTHFPIVLEVEKIFAIDLANF